MVSSVPQRALVVVLLAVVLAAATAGCVAMGNDDPEDKVLKSWSRSAPTEASRTVNIEVPSGLDELKIVVTTKAAKSSGGDDQDFYGCGQWCDEWADMDDDEADVDGIVSFTVRAPGNIQKDTAPHGYNEEETFTYPKPKAGTWSVQVSYQGYEGPAAMRAVEPVEAEGALFGGTFWDVSGVVLAVGALIGGWLLYNRRSRFLSRELHRMDSTVKHFSENVDECRKNLLIMRGDLKELLVKRKIQESQYMILDKRLEQYLVDLDTPGDKHAEAAKANEPAPPGSALQRIRRAGG